jgi:hypothetical protein
VTLFSFAHGLLVHRTRLDFRRNPALVFGCPRRFSVEYERSCSLRCARPGPTLRPLRGRGGLTPWLARFVLGLARQVRSWAAPQDPLVTRWVFGRRVCALGSRSRSRVVSLSSSVSSLRLDTPSRACFLWVGYETKVSKRRSPKARRERHGRARRNRRFKGRPPVPPCVSSEQASPEEGAGLHAGCGRASRRCVRCVLTPRDTPGRRSESRGADGAVHERPSPFLEVASGCVCLEKSPQSWARAELLAGIVLESRLVPCTRRAWEKSARRPLASIDCFSRRIHAALTRPGAA